MIKLTDYLIDVAIAFVEAIIGLACILGVLYLLGRMW